MVPFDSWLICGGMQAMQAVQVTNTRDLSNKDTLGKQLMTLIIAYDEYNLIMWIFLINGGVN